MGVNPVDFIAAKRDGREHSRAELDIFMGDYVRGAIPDYQVAAWLMAVVWRGMTSRETAALTQAMAESGEMVDLSAFPHSIDKHSTGGVGDKTTLVVAPLLAALGAQVAKMSGRGLGHTGGTVDKLESIPGFRAELSSAAFMQQVAELGIAVTGQSGDLAPADRLLYALRDVTGTVPSLPLIASSIMSKKLAGGARTLVLDVKVGAGAFMKTRAEALALAQAMVSIGEHAGRNVRALISNMDEPLGHAVGHTLEVQEAMETLAGGGPADLRALAVALAREGLVASGLPEAAAEVEKALDDGRALARFTTWVHAQGGRLGAWDVAPEREVVRAPHSGTLRSLNAEGVGRAVAALGGGRLKKGDVIDVGVGAMVHAKVGAQLAAGDAILTLYHRGRGLESALALLQGAFEVGDALETPRPGIMRLGDGAEGAP